MQTSRSTAGSIPRRPARVPRRARRCSSRAPPFLARRSPARPFAPSRPPCHESAGSRIAWIQTDADHGHVPTTVLVVDDHQSFRRTARSLLESEGFDVVGEADDGMSALRASRELQPHLVLLDVNPPDIAGFGAAPRVTAPAT